MPVVQHRQLPDSNCVWPLTSSDNHLRKTTGDSTSATWRQLNLFLPNKAFTSRHTTTRLCCSCSVNRKMFPNVHKLHTHVCVCLTPYWRYIDAWSYGGETEVQEEGKESGEEREGRRRNTIPRQAQMLAGLRSKLQFVHVNITPWTDEDEYRNASTSIRR